MIVMYGIPNCDTVKKARSNLEQRGVDYVFHDVKKQPVAKERLMKWVNTLGVDKVVNRKSTTWRKLDEQMKQAMDGENAVQVLAQHPTLMKRPLLEVDDNCYVGFDEQLYHNLSADMSHS